MAAQQKKSPMERWCDKTVKLMDLCLDEDNPRHPSFSDQRSTLQWFVKNMPAKTYTLAERLSETGMDPTDRPLVIPSDDSPNTYTVMDGNRRIAALKFLENPNLAPTVPSQHRFKEIAKKRPPSIQEIEVVVAPTREECMPSIIAKHYGEAGGAGRVQWNALARLRSDYMVGLGSRYLPVLWVVNMVGSTGEQLPEDTEIPTTNIERMLKDPHVREFIGIDIRQEKLYKHFPDEEILKPLLPIVRDLISKKIKVGDIKSKQLRRKYMSKLGRSARPDGSKRLPNPIEVNLRDGQTQAVQRSQRQRTGRTSKPRANLIPRDTNLYITNEQVEKVYNELRSMNVNRYPNAVACLFRVFLEISFVCYIHQHRLDPQKDQTLAGQMKVIVRHLKDRKRFTQEAANSIISMATNPNSIFGVRTFHGYVHTLYQRPVSENLRDHWDNFAPFIQAIWQEK